MLVEAKPYQLTKGTCHQEKLWSVQQSPEWEPKEIIHMLGLEYVYWNLGLGFNHAACAESIDRYRQVEVLAHQGHAVQYMQQAYTCESLT